MPKYREAKIKNIQEFVALVDKEKGTAEKAGNDASGRGGDKLGERIPGVAGGIALELQHQGQPGHKTRPDHP